MCVLLRHEIFLVANLFFLKTCVQVKQITVI